MRDPRSHGFWVTEARFTQGLSPGPVLRPDTQLVTTDSTIMGLGRGTDQAHRPLQPHPDHQQAAGFMQEMLCAARLRTETLHRWKKSAPPHGVWGQAADPANIPVSEAHCVLHRPGVHQGWETGPPASPQPPTQASNVPLGSRVCTKTPLDLALSKRGTAEK